MAQAADIQSRDRKDGSGEDLASMLRTAEEQYRRGADYDKDNRNEALEDLKFAAGDQWHQADLQERGRPGKRRPTMTINRMGQFVKQVTGEIRRNKPAIQCAPGDDAADVKTAQIYEGLIRSIERASNASRHYARAADQSARCGMGHLRLKLVYADDTGFDLDLRIETIRNPFSVVWDHNAVQEDKSDAKWCFVVCEMDEAEFKAKFPNASVSSFALSRPISPQADRSSVNTNRTVTLAEYWKVHEDPSTIVEMVHRASGARTTLVNPDPIIIAEALNMGFVMGRRREATKRRVCSYLLNGTDVLAGPVEWPGARIPIFTVIGEEIDVGDVVYRHGMIRFAKDSQRAYNYAKSAEAESIGLAPKAPFIIADEQIEGFEDEWASANQAPKPYIRYRYLDGEGNRIEAPPPRREPPPSTNPGLTQMAQGANDDMKAAIGVYDASLGQRSNETSGVAIEARDAQTDTATFVYVDNLVGAIEAIGREIVTVIPKIYDAQRQIRILGDDDAVFITTLEREGVDPNRGKYDVIVKTGPSYKTERDKAAQTLAEAARGAAPPFQPILWMEMFKNLNIKDYEELNAKIEAVAIAQGILPPPPGAMPPPGPMGMGAPPASAPVGAPAGAPIPPRAGPPRPAGPPPLRARPGVPPGVFANISPTALPARGERVGRFAPAGMGARQ